MALQNKFAWALAGFGALALMLSAWTLVRANGGTITACVGNSGLPRIVSDAGECRHNESPLSWNVQGEKGDKGDSGNSITKDNYYTMTHGPFSVTGDGIANSFGIGCASPDDIAIASGMDSYTGPINLWRLVRSRPDSVAQDSWLHTVLFIGNADQEVTFTLKCLRLSQDGA